MCGIILYTKISITIMVNKVKKMNFKRYRQSVSLLLFFLIIVFMPLHSLANIKTPDEHIVSLNEIESLSINVKFGIGEINLGSGRDSIFEARFYYEDGILKPNIIFDVFEKNGLLELSQTIRKDIGLLFSLQNLWDIKLPSNIPLKIKMNTATCHGKIDLSNIQVEEFFLLSGASDTSILFNQPNKVHLKKINIKTGASSLSIFGLANANFSKMDFIGGAGKYTFDFSGILKTKSEIKIDVGAAKVVLKIPINYGTRIKFPRFLTTNLKIMDFIKINEQVYVNHEYGRKNEEFDIEINGPFLGIEVVSLSD